ncbi:MAG: hypothetical protein AAGU17_13230 [Anaerolineaceae bacterium]|jgi:hypothetical protein
MTASGTPLNRQWVIVLNDGMVVIDWGDGVYQDIVNGDFLSIREEEVSHHITNRELDWLIKTGRVASYDNLIVRVHSLPERPLRTME